MCIRDRTRYLNKISGPLLDRFDLFIEVNPVSYEDLHNYKKAESSNDIKLRVETVSYTHLYWQRLGVMEK